MTYFTYNGRSSAEFGLHIEKKDVPWAEQVQHDHHYLRGAVLGG